jgi:hypothetical protein
MLPSVTCDRPNTALKITTKSASSSSSLSLSSVTFLVFRSRLRIHTLIFSDTTTRIVVVVYWRLRGNTTCMLVQTLESTYQITYHNSENRNVKHSYSGNGVLHEPCNVFVSLSALSWDGYKTHFTRCITPINGCSSCSGCLYTNRLYPGCFQILKKQNIWTVQVQHSTTKYPGLEISSKNINLTRLIYLCIRISFIGLWRWYINTYSYHNFLYSGSGLHYD